MISADTDSDPIVFAPDGVRLPSMGSSAIGGELLLARNPHGENAALVLGAPDGSRIELGSVTLGIGASVSSDGSYDWARPGLSTGASWSSRLARPTASSHRC